MSVSRELTATIVACAVCLLVRGMEVDLYLNKDKFGEFFKLRINEKGCTNVPLNWENQALSLDTHGSCIKFYDLPYCKGKYVALQPYHGTFQDNLETLGFNKIISSASPCGPKVPSGRYYIQNGADGSVLTVEMKNNTPVARTHTFKPYISKGQQFQVEKVSISDYEVIPRVHQKLNPLTFDMSVSTNAHPVRRVWKIESVYRGRYIIKNEWNNNCLYKSDTGKVEEHECVAWSPNQEWIFRSIKVKPYFPTKEELKKKPIRPDDVLNFQPQDDAFSAIPYQPNPSTSSLISSALSSKLQTKSKKKGSQVQVQRPGPIVLNPGEPFPPVFPYPILPKIKTPTGHKKDKPKPPVPHVRHPGPLPFPSEPVIIDPNKPTVSPLDNLNVFGTQQIVNPLGIVKNNTTKKKPEKDSSEEDSSAEDDYDDLYDDQASDEYFSGNGNRRKRPGSRPRPSSHGPPKRRPGPPLQDDIGYDDYGPPQRRPRPAPPGSKNKHRPPGPRPRPQQEADLNNYGPPKGKPRPPAPYSGPEDDIEYQDYGPPKRRPEHDSKRKHRPSRPRPGSEEDIAYDDYGPSRPHGPRPRPEGPQGLRSKFPASDISSSDEDVSYEDYDIPNKASNNKHKEQLAGVKYSDFRLYF